MPRISVILPVFNGERYLSRAIEGILRQSFTDFELIIIDDGSSDRSRDIALKYSDSRIIIKSQPNMGLARTLNRGIGLSTGEIVIRHDQDDWSEDCRFQKQVDFLNSNPKISLVGTSANVVTYSSGRVSSRVHNHPANHESIVLGLMFDSQFFHGSVAVRRSALVSVGGYSESDLQPPEDYELWTRMAQHFRFANIQEPLIKYYQHKTSMSSMYRDRIEANRKRISAKNITNLTSGGITLAEATRLNVIYASGGRCCHNQNDYVLVKRLFDHLKLNEPLEGAKAEARHTLTVLRRKFLLYIIVSKFRISILRRVVSYLFSISGIQK